MGTSPPKTKENKTKPKRQYDSQLDLHCRHSYWYHCFTPAPFVAQHHRVIRKWKVRVAVIKQWLENVSVLCGDYTAGCSDWATRAAQTGPRGLPAPSAWPTNAAVRHCVACVNWSAVEWLEHTPPAGQSQREDSSMEHAIPAVCGGVARTAHRQLARVSVRTAAWSTQYLRSAR